MSKRTRLKLRNIRMYFAKYIFNGRYIVRNILAMTVLMTVVVLVAGASMVIGNAKERKAAEAAENSENIIIDAYEITAIDSESISILKGDLEGRTQTVVQANDSQMVSGATSEFDAKFVATSDDINIRSEANTGSDIVGKLNNGAVGDILSSNGEWLNISSGDVTGYVKAEFVLTGKDAEEYAKDYYSVTGTITDDDVCVRAEASKEADIIETAYNGSTYNVDKAASTAEWVCVSTADGSTGYIYAEFVSITEGYPTAVAVDGTKDDGDSSDEDDIMSEEDNTEAEAEDNSEDTTDETEATTEESATEEEPSSDSTAAEEEEPSDNQTTVGITNRGAIALSEEDINLMASILTLECGGESYEGQLAVANVIINRMLSGRWGSTVSDVVYAPYQFSVATSPQLDYYIENGAQASCIQAVREAASGVNNIGSYMSFRPTWNIDTSSLGSYTIIGNHVFY